MEQKSIGTFLSALRRASGMTQRQIAQKLNVSDKAVSRWERDECAPDLSLIPVLAEIYGVTSDEILRGEKRTVQTEQTQYEAKKAEKQVAWLLKQTEHKFSVRSLIAACVAALGAVLLHYIILNFLYNFAYVGAVGIIPFVFALVFFLPALILEIVFFSSAFAALDTETENTQAVKRTKGRIIKKGEVAFAAIGALFALSFSLFLDQPPAGLAYAAAALLLLGLAAALVNERLHKNGVFLYVEAEEKIYPQKRKLQRKCALVFVGLSLIACIGFIVVNNTPTTTLSPYTEFTDMAAFQEYMRTDESDVTPSEDITEMMEEEFEEIYITEYLYSLQDPETPAVSYQWLNNNVRVVEPVYDENGALIAVRVYTTADYMHILHRITGVILGIYLLAVILLLLYYNAKRKKLMA